MINLSNSELITTYQDILCGDLRDYSSDFTIKIYELLSISHVLDFNLFLKDIQLNLNDETGFDYKKYPELSLLGKNISYDKSKEVYRHNFFYTISNSKVIFYLSFTRFNHSKKIEKAQARQINPYLIKRYLANEHNIVFENTFDNFLATPDCSSIISKLVERKVTYFKKIGHIPTSEDFFEKVKTKFGENNYVIFSIEEKEYLTLLRSNNAKIEDIRILKKTAPDLHFIVNIVSNNAQMTEFIIKNDSMSISHNNLKNQFTFYYFKSVIENWCSKLLAVPDTSNFRENMRNLEFKFCSQELDQLKLSKEYRYYIPYLIDIVYGNFFSKIKNH